ncbi:restriction endonuclease subunit S [Porphyromonas crevioricanis]|uniref:restriction endonuclease subunit S n=1 Tax=Porphyromonas crevioricanis TaxID=393921 RepID=UPI00068A947C|nr:restriction endonuclease subunit S [Porphyromonas crevioricanis]
MNDISKSILYGVSESAKSEGNYKLLRITDIQDNQVDWGTVPFTDFDEDKVSSYILHDGDIVFARTGATVGKSYLIKGLRQNTIYASYLIRVQTFDSIFPEYVKLFFESGYYWEQIELGSVGIGQPNVNGTILGNLNIPLPSFAEQKRIVLEIERWFSLIGSIEKGKGELRVITKHARNKILDLAIHGKLVPQDPNDEPAIQLLKRINPDFTPCDNGHNGKLPQGWAHCQLKNVLKITMGQSPKGNSLNNKRGIEFHQGKICFSDKFLLESGIYTNKPTKIAEPKSILLCVRAPVGAVNITNNQICIGRGLCALTPFEGNAFFYFYLLQTLQDSFDNQATGSTFKAISGEVIRNESIILPPLAEQQRIVQKIEKLFSVLDNIQNALEV